MSGDQECDAPRQHPTERELFGEWWTHDFWGREDVVENPSPEKDEHFAALSAWQAGRAPLLKRIEELEFALAYSGTSASIATAKPIGKIECVTIRGIEK